MARNWYQRPVLVFFVFLSLCLIMAFAARNMELGQSSSSSYHLFSVEFDYFGMDAESLESLIALPLEEAVMGLPGLMDMEIQCQYGKVSGTFYFYPTEKQKNVYLWLRDKVDTLYRDLPQGVQKPRILSSAASGAGKDRVLSIAIPVNQSSSDNQGLRSFLENQLKPQLESVEGVSQVVVAGGGVDEILLQFNPDRMAAGNINPMALGQIIQEANSVAPGTWLQLGGKRLPLVFETQIQQLEHIRQLPVQTGKGVAHFEHFAQISRQQRPPEELVRVNGKECLSLVVHASYDGNLMAISKACRKIIDGALNQADVHQADVYQDDFSGLDYQLLYDRGEELAQIMKNILVALAQSLLLILLLVPAFFPQARITGLVLLFLPTTVLWTGGQLNLLGFSLNRHTLSGITIALGLVADTAFVVAEFWNQTRWKHDVLVGDNGDFFHGIGSLQRSMVASSLTTILVFLPLYFLDSLVPGIREVAVTMALMIVNSLVLGGFFLPVFLEIGTETRQLLLPQSVSQSVEEIFVKKSLALCDFTRNRQKPCLAILCCLSVLPVLLALVAGKNLTLEENPSFITASVEYPTDTAASVIDQEVAPFIQEVKKFESITFVTSRSTTGVCQLELGIDSTKVTGKKATQQLLDSIQSLSSQLHSGSLHVNNQQHEGKQVHEIQVAVVGDESQQCKDYARRCIEASGHNSSIVQGVLNFKEAETLVLVRPQLQQLARIGLELDQVAQSLRWLIFGPVVDKWIQASGEEDIRVVGKIAETNSRHLEAALGKNSLTGESNSKKMNLSQLESMTIPIVASGKVDSAGGAGGLPLSALAQVELQPGRGKLYRLNGRPCAYFTLQVAAASTQDAMQLVEDFLQDFPLEKGYSYHLSRQVRELSHHYQILALALMASVVGIFLLLCALREKPLEAFLVSTLIPSSLALPVLVLALLGKTWESGDIVGMVLVAGLGVNNGIYLIQSTKEYMFIQIQDKIASIFITSLSTIIGAIPLLLCESGSFAASLSFFMVWGTAGSLLTSLLVFPAVIDFFYRRYR